MSERIHIGAKITRTPKTFGLSEKDYERKKIIARRYTGTVVYIHPKKRWYTLEYEFPAWGGGIAKIRESYLWDE